MFSSTEIDCGPSTRPQPYPNTPTPKRDACGRKKPQKPPRQKVSRAELKEYYESLEDQEERQAAKLRFNIANLERKNQKRRNSIVTLSKKASEGQLSAEEKVALQRNKINLAEGEEKLVRLNERLSYML